MIKRGTMSITVVAVHIGACRIGSGSAAMKPGQLLIGLALIGLVGVAWADDAPIAGTIKSIDTAAGTITVEAAAKGKVRVVAIDVKPEARIVRFVREAGKSGFVERPATLADLKPGWSVSVTTRHEGEREVAEIVKVVFER
jgi:hypothetical protein